MFYPHKRTMNTSAIYHFDGNANDASGNNNNGTVTGATLVGGRFGQAYSFDGTDDYIEIAYAASLANTTAFTLAGWFNFNDFAENKRLANMFTNETANNRRGWIWSMNTGPNFNITVYANSTDAVNPGKAVAVSLSVNTWYHLVATYNAGTIELYIDGKNVGGTYQGEPVPTAIVYDATVPMWMGRLKWAGVFYYASEIHDDIIYENVVWSAAEVKARYNKGRMIYPH